MPKRKSATFIFQGRILRRTPEGLIEDFTNEHYRGIKAFADYALQANLPTAPQEPNLRGLRCAE